MADDFDQPNDDPFERWCIAVAGARVADGPLMKNLRIAEYAVNAVCEKRFPLLLICSIAGLGKNYLVRKMVKKHGLKKVAEIRPQSESGLYYDLWENKDADVILFNETEHFARNTGMIQMLKLATDVGEGRKVTFSNAEIRKKGRDPDADVPPTSFQVTAGIIWLSNTNYTDPKNITVALQQHWQALLSRGMNPRWLDTGGDQGMFNYCLHLILRGDLLRNLGVRLDDANTVLRTLVTTAEYLTTLSPRSVVRMAESAKYLRKIGATGPDVWKSETDVMLSSRPQRSLKLPLDGDGEPLWWCKITPRPKRAEAPEPELEPPPILLLEAPKPPPAPDPEPVPEPAPKKRGRPKKAVEGEEVPKEPKRTRARKAPLADKPKRAPFDLEQMYEMVKRATSGE